MSATYTSTVSAGSTPNLADYDVILINTSGGKDSQVMLEHVTKLAKRAGLMDRVVAVHADLGEMEWEGTAELAQAQVEFHGVSRFEVVSRPQGNILSQVLDRHEKLEAEVAEGKRAKMSPAWPSSAARYCTSDHKRGQVRKLITALTDEVIASGVTGRPVRILNVMGLRAQESSARAKKATYRVDGPASNDKRQVDEWLPIHAWTEAMVWANIKLSGAPYHPAYDLGMSRLSCRFCVLACESDLIISAKANPALAQEYLAVEQLTGFDFIQGRSMASIIEKAAA